MSYFILKIIALITMTIDHVGYLLNNNINCRLIGRLAFPLYCFLIVNGFYHTKSKKQYILRLFIFAIISEIPFDLFFNEQNILIGQNVFFTLFLGLFLITILDKLKTIICQEKILKYRMIYFFVSLSLIFLISIISEFIRSDYGWFGILLICMFYIFYGNKNINKIYMMLGLVFINLLYFLITNQSIEIFSILDVIFIISFEDKNVKINKIVKYICYFYYPIHLLILYFLKVYFI